MARGRKNRAGTNKPAKTGAKAPVKSQSAVTLNKANNVNSMKLSKSISMVCSLTDPFCEHARSGKYFDSNGARSLTYPTRRMLNIVTNANGEQAYILMPNFNCAFQSVASVLPAGTADATFGNVSATSSLLTTVGNYRLTSWGFRIKHVVTPLNANGMVSIRGFSSQSGSSYGTVNCLTMNADVVANVPVQDCKDVAIVGKRANNTSSFYTAPATTWSVGAFPSAWVGNGWDVYTIYISGATAGTHIVTLEIYENFEVVINDDDPMAQLMTAPPPANDLVTKATAAVTSTAHSVFEKGLEAASNYVKKAAAGAIASYLGGPAAGRTAMLMVD
nr:hypothetical protein [Sobelivirales sp.]